MRQLICRAALLACFRPTKNHNKIRRERIGCGRIIWWRARRRPLTDEPRYDGAGALALLKSSTAERFLTGMASRYLCVPSVETPGGQYGAADERTSKTNHVVWVFSKINPPLLAAGKIAKS